MSEPNDFSSGGKDRIAELSPKTALMPTSFSLISPDFVERTRRRGIKIVMLPHGSTVAVRSGYVFKSISN